VDSENLENVHAGTGPSRRDFLKGAAAGGAVAAFAGVFSSLTGCAADDGAASGDNGAASESTYPFGVYDTDVLIIGGGVAGLTAARKAMANGAMVTVVDKGPWGSCGTSGINWGHDIETNEWYTGDMAASLPIFATMNDGLLNQTYGMAMFEGLRQARPAAYAEQVGIVVQRMDGGVPAAGNADVPLTIDHGYFLRWHARDIKLKGADVHDRTFILDILKDEQGAAVGAVGINLISGDAMVFRAKSVVLATGSYIWAAGYNGEVPYTIGSPENTGDGFRMLLDAGVSFADMEHIVHDIAQWAPKGCRQGMGGICGSTPTHVHILDKDKKRVTEALDAGGGYPEFFRLLAKAELDGRTFEVPDSDSGAFYVDTAGIGLPLWNRYYARVPENYKVALGYELPQYVKDVWSQWDCAGKPSKLNQYSETVIPGVFYAAASEGAAFMSACGSGWIAGDGASLKAKSADTLPAVPWEQVNTLLTDAYGLLDAEPSDGIRAAELFRSIQKAYWSGCKPLRSADNLNACIQEVDRIESEDLPKMHVPIKTRRFNTDWLRALEAKSLLRITKATALSALAREESRGYNCRIDFPKIDNTNWLKNVNVTFANGQWTTELTDIDDSVIPAEALAPFLATYGLE